MRNAPRALLAGLICALALSLAACGSSSRLLSSQEAGSLNAALNQIQGALDRHDCETAQANAFVLESRVEQLPSSVNATARASLERAASTVKRLVANDCPRQVPTTTQPQTTQAPTTSSTPTTTTTPPPKKPKPKPPKPATTTTTPGTTTGPPSGTGPGQGHGHGGHGHGHGPGGGDGQGGGGGGDDNRGATTP